MSHRIEQKKSQTSLPTNLSNRAKSTNILKKKESTFDKQDILNSSINTNEHNKNNTTELKDKERNH